MTIFLLLFVVVPVSWSEEDEEKPFCNDPEHLVLKNEPPDRSKLNPSLLNPDEAADPEAARKLAATPGPYGHSELGFRYLARLFGYPGKFEGREKVERWVAEEEINDRNQKKGLRKIWQKWVVNSEYRLAVPSGPISRIPANANADVFFKDIYQRADFSRCVNLEQSLLFCKNLNSANYLDHMQTTADGQNAQTVRLGTVTSRSPCSIKNHYHAIKYEKWRMDVWHKHREAGNPPPLEGDERGRPSSTKSAE